MKNLLAAIVLLVLPAAAAAEEHAHDPAQIALQMVEEAWVETETARVVVQLKTLLTGDKAAEPVVDPKAIFAPVADGDWQMTQFHRGQTDTGFEQWVIVAEARIPQASLTGIYDRVKDASSRGRTISVQHIDFSPSLAERQATAAKLRAALYKRAADEAAAIDAVFPDRGFAVHRIDFLPGGMPQPVMLRAQAEDARAFAGRAKQAGPTLSERMVLHATVIIAADE